jgi:methylmalonyl-CoA mutase cobalamin-binding domain/chain
MTGDSRGPKKVLLAPLDPVHDVGAKLIARALRERGHDVMLLPPDLSPEEVVSRASQASPDYIMVSRTISYGTPELLAKFADMCDAAGLRSHAKLVVGGMSIRKETAQELGFDAGFGPDTTPQEVADYVSGTTDLSKASSQEAVKPDLTQKYTYDFADPEIGKLCHEIAKGLIDWASQRTSPGIERARLRMEIEKTSHAGESEAARELRGRYSSLTGGDVRKWYETGTAIPHTRPLTPEEIQAFDSMETTVPVPLPSQKPLDSANVIMQYGTGCPVMDAYHIRLSLAWGAKGAVHFDPSWGARTEGLAEGTLSHQHDGTVLTLQNLRLVKRAVHPGALWQVRAHRGLNTPETVVLAHLAGADLTKINIVYGSLGAGTDPERLAVDGVECLRLAAQFGLPYDVVTNEELCGVPARKAFAGMLVVATAGILLGGRPILQPLFADSPEAMVSGFTGDNLVDFNAAKMLALKSMIDAPVWPGAPVGFMTQTQDRCQSATMTALHAALGLRLGAEAVTIASSDEAYAGGPISAQARVDTLKAVAASLRFLGSSRIAPTPRAQEMARDLRKGILETLIRVHERGDFVASLYEGLLGDREDGAYPGRAGQGTVSARR